MIRAASAVVFTAFVLFATSMHACSQDFAGIGIAQTISDVEVVQGQLDVDTTLAVGLAFPQSKNSEQCDEPKCSISRFPMAASPIAPVQRQRSHIDSRIVPRYRVSRQP